MKKITFVAAMAIAAVTLGSCGQSRPPKADFKNDTDSLSYSLGVNMANGLTFQVLSEQFGVDSAYVGEFLRGLNESFRSADDKKQAAYFIGAKVGSDINSNVMSFNKHFFGEDSTKYLNAENILAAFNASVNKQELVIPLEKAQEIQQRFISEQEKVQQAKQREENKKKQAEEWAKLDKENAQKFADNKAAGEKFLAENKTKEGIKVTPSGIQYKVIKEGDGKQPEEGSYVKVNYEGRLIDGTVFDSSYERKQPAQFSLDQVIAGWTEILQMMKTGSTYEVYIPQELAYGPAEKDKIKPYSALIFKIELLEVLR